MVDRVVDTIARAGFEGGYFASAADRDAFADELKYLMVNQHASFNSPVWFNIGVEGVPQQASACFILSVEDDMHSILDWFRDEGIIFKGGSGSGVNVSRIRSQKENLSGGGFASGPVSFMRGADSVAGSIKSGGTTRRAAKMVILDADHPDVHEFIWCKAKEEKKAWALGEAGYDMSLNGEAWRSIQFQNANNSVRVTDEFMKKAQTTEDWALTARVGGTVLETVKARALLGEIADRSPANRRALRADEVRREHPRIHEPRDCGVAGGGCRRDPAGGGNAQRDVRCHSASLHQRWRAALHAEPPDLDHQSRLGRSRSADQPRRGPPQRHSDRANGFTLGAACTGRSYRQVMAPRRVRDHPRDPHSLERRPCRAHRPPRW
jgi:hypothetical protein